jgi:hypothetical protein|tara:strand:+ start:702 stop:827 length:126 start_codon:yes stop_codon:yes gene_type:complete
MTSSIPDFLRPGFDAINDAELISFDFFDEIDKKGSRPCHWT